MNPLAFIQTIPIQYLCPRVEDHNLSILMKTRWSKAVKHFKTLRGFYEYCCGNSSSIWCSDSDSDFSSSAEESSGTSSPDLNQQVSRIAPNDEDLPVLDTLYTIYFDFLLITLMKSFAQKVKENRVNIVFLLDSSVRIRTFFAKDGELSWFIHFPGLFIFIKLLTSSIPTR